MHNRRNQIGSRPTVALRPAKASSHDLSPSPRLAATGQPRRAADLRRPPRKRQVAGVDISALQDGAPIALTRPGATAHRRKGAAMPLTLPETQAATSPATKRRKRAEIARRRKQHVLRKRARQAEVAQSPATAMPIAPTAPATLLRIPDLPPLPMPDPAVALTEPELPFFTPALPLAPLREALVETQLPANAKADHAGEASGVPLPRNRALARPTTDLWSAITCWLRSAARLLSGGFLVRRPTPPRRAYSGEPASHAVPGRASTRSRRDAPVSLREKTEMLQLRAENRRLRQELLRLNGRNAAPVSASAEKEPQPPVKHREPVDA